MLTRLVALFCMSLILGTPALADQNVRLADNCINKAACGMADPSDERDAGATPEVNMLSPEYVDPSMPSRTESGAKNTYPFGEPAYGDPVTDHRDCVNAVTGAVRGNEAEANRLCRERN